MHTKLAIFAALANADADAGVPVPVEGRPGEPLRAGFVLFEAFDERGASIAREALKVRKPPGYLHSLEVLETLSEYGALNFTYVRLPNTTQAGRYAGEQVVMSINGVAAEIPRTTWVMSTTRVPPGGGSPSTIENALPSMTVLLPGDVCTWRLLPFDKIEGVPVELVDAVKEFIAFEEMARKNESAPTLSDGKPVEL
jgi:hypothetical protein